MWEDIPARDRDNESYDCYWTFLQAYNDSVTGPHVVGAIWNKWLVTKTVERDLVAGSPDMITQYEYLGGAGWARQVKTAMPPAGCWFGSLPTCEWGDGEWTEWRGYPTVRVLKGTGTDATAYGVTTTSFFRGLYEDTLANGTPKNTTVTDFDGAQHNDLRAFTGKPCRSRASWPPAPTRPSSCVTIRRGWSIRPTPPASASPTPATTGRHRE